MESNSVTWKKLCEDLFSVEEEFFRVVKNINPELRDKNVPSKNWSPKDILAHIAGWEVEVVKQFKEFLVNPDADDNYDIDSFNEKSVSSRKSKTWDEIMKELELSQKELSAFISTLSQKNVDAEDRFSEWVEVLINHYKHHMSQLQKLTSNYVIKEVEQIVEKACSRDRNVFGYGIWTHHILRVVKIGKKLAERFGADPEIVEIAALLHDYAGIKDHSLHKEHHIHGAIEAEKILKDLNYSKQKIETVKHCIENHRGSVPGKRGTPEAECLASADAIAHIENVPSLFYLAYARFDMGIEDGEEWILKKLNRTWKKINPEIRYLVEEKYKSAIITITKKENQSLDTK
jgi:uncharacterized protein